MSQSISERGDKVGYSSGVASLLMTEFSCLRCAPACSPGILRRVLLPSAAKKKGLHFSRLRLTLTSHVNFIKKTSLTLIKNKIEWSEIERNIDRDRERHTHTHTQRERERERERERKIG